MVKYPGSGGDFGSFDLVTTFRMIDNNALAQRSAYGYGARLLNLTAKLSPGSKHSDGFFQSTIDDSVDFGDMSAWKESFRNVRSNYLEKFLSKSYTLIPNSRDLRWRTLILDQKNESFYVHVPSTLKICMIPSDHPQLAHFETLLEAEKEYESNPEVLRKIASIEKVPPVFNWHI